MQDSQQDLIVEVGKKPFVCPTDPQEKEQCEACQ